MNRRRPWHQRLVRRFSRYAQHGERRVPVSPLALLGVLNTFGCLCTFGFGVQAVALVLGTAAAGCLGCQFRKQSDILM